MISRKIYNTSTRLIRFDRSSYIGNVYYILEFRDGIYCVIHRYACTIILVTSLTFARNMLLLKTIVNSKSVK